MINTINNASSVQTTLTVKPEAAPAGQPDETTQVQQNSSGKTANSSQAVLVALESIITTELTELSQTVANRAALIKSLPPEIRELVQQLVSQNQAAQTTLQEGLVALLKSSKTGAEKLAMLADIMEQAAGLTAEEGQGSDAKQPEVPQRPGNLSPNNSQNLSTKLVMPTGDSVKSQELAQLLRAFATQPELVEGMPPEIRELVLTLLQQEEPSSQAGQTKSNQQNPSTQQILLTGELGELTQTIANRTAQDKSLPPENREPVQQLLSQNQAVQTSLLAGVVALLKSSKTRADKTAMLADIMEGQGEASSPAATDKQQLQTELTAALQGKNSGDLQEMVKVLRQLAARSNVQGNNQPNQGPDAKQPEMPQRQENSPNNSQNLPTKPATLAGDSVKSQELAQLLKAFTTQPELKSLPPEIRKIVLTILQQEESGQEQAAQTTQPEAKEGQGPGAKQSQLPQRQENSPNNPQNLPAKPTTLAGFAVKSQESAQLLRAFATQPELVESLPPEIRKLVLTILQPEEPASPTAQKTQTTQMPAQQTPRPTTQSSAPTLTAQASSSQAGQPMQTLPAAVAELVTALNKSQQSPSEKIIVFANILEQAAELLTSKQPQAAQSFGLSQQAMVELANIWQEKSPEEVKAAIKVVQELAETMSKPSGVTAERQDAQRVLSIAVPLYFGDGQTVYPAYIHVYYQEEEDKKNPGQKVTETWLRICLETENIGMVDAAFRLYDGNNLDVKVRFSDAEAASGFADSMEEVKEQLGQLPLTVGEFLVK
ncbi:hypothetical protein SPSIL_043910 [Sporomusa silvacetica DSM 10669]|uniref:Flagellar hook-length control protein FliK n=2 Tax=Sporomusa silvacetica TaxID=55504 RepID=A0ABZ3IR30_9FIRM|nr:hypothetical protein SPSIL_15200 [Sporomusa silvacetica DSM 10669]